MEPILADYYHRHHSAYSEDIPFWLELAKEQGDPILELGCGTGRVLLKLVEAGYSVWGIDHDRKMLAVLKEQITGEESHEPVLRRANITNFQLSMQFPLILLPCNTYSTFMEEERLAALGVVNCHLLPGGVFAISIPNPSWMAQLPPEAEPEVEVVFEHPRSGNPVQVSSAWQREGDEVVVSWHYDHLFPDGRVKRASTETHHCLTDAQEYMEEFESQGWKVTTYGDFNFTAYDAESVYLILVGRKK